MYHKARRLALKTITRTPLEPAARRVYGVFVPSKGNTYDKQTFTVMRNLLNSDSNCIDVGAYRGEILNQIQKICPKGDHFAFEPVPENYDFLVKKFPKATVHNMALGAKKGKVKFQHVVGRAARSGIKKVEYPDQNQEIQEINITVEALDNVIPKNTPINFLKIDVEGGELGVLQGAKKLIQKYKPMIVFEHEQEKSSHYGTKQPEQIYDLMTKDLGMNIYLMDAFLQKNKPLSRSAFLKTVKDNSDFYFMAIAKS